MVPKRTLSPALILIGIATAAFWVLLLWAGVDAYKVPRLKGLTVASAVVTFIGIFLWKGEGRRSLRKQSAIYQRACAGLLQPAIFRLSDSGWSVTSEGAEDHRAFASLRAFHETANTIMLVTDVVHVLPKRIFELQELQQLLSLTSGAQATSAAGAQASGMPLRHWDFVSASFDYYRWRYPGYLLMFFLAPPFALVVAVLSAYLDPDPNSSVLPLQLRFILVATIVWYSAFPLYEYVHATRKFRDAVLASLDETGFVLRIGSYEHNIRWEQPFIGHEGRKSFLVEVNRGYFLIPKRLLNTDQMALVRRKLESNASAATTAG